MNVINALCLFVAAATADAAATAVVITGKPATAATYIRIFINKQHNESSTLNAACKNGNTSF